MSQQFINENELNSIKGLIHYLNESGWDERDGPQRALDAEVFLHDSNGEALGTIKWHAGAYALFLPEASA